MRNTFRHRGPDRAQVETVRTLAERYAATGDGEPWCYGKMLEEHPHLHAIETRADGTPKGQDTATEALAVLGRRAVHHAAHAGAGNALSGGFPRPPAMRLHSASSQPATGYGTARGHLVAHGYDIRTVKDFLGHRSVRTSMIYTTSSTAEPRRREPR